MLNFASGSVYLTRLLARDPPALPMLGVNIKPKELYVSIITLQNHLFSLIVAPVQYAWHAWAQRCMTEDYAVS
jgi:hypothetical protein